LKLNAARFILVLIFFLAWEAITRFGHVSHIIMAPPSVILAAVFKILIGASRVPEFYRNFRITVVEIGAAYAMAASLGLFLGFIIGKSKLISDAYEPILLVLFSIPKIIIYPIIFLLLGIDMMPKIAFGVIMGIFSIIFNTAAGLRQVEERYVILARVVGCTPLETFFKVVLPAAAPTILSGLRLGFGYTVIGVVVGELLVVNAGMGFLIDWAAFQFFTPELYALIILTMMVGITGNALFARIERIWVR
jgi:NitT/TauT family transport system permease protein